MNRLTPVVKNLLILNGLMFLATMVLQGQGIDLNGMLGLYYPGSDAFKPVQLIAHMFLHGGFMHLFFNMFALWMFGGILEQRFGPQRFLTYYLVTGFGAAMLHLAVIHLQVMGLTAEVDAETCWKPGATTPTPPWASSTSSTTSPRWAPRGPCSACCWPSACSSPTCR
jgi:hypothetical protein